MNDPVESNNGQQYVSFEEPRERAKELWDQVALINGYSARLPAVARSSRIEAERERQRMSEDALEATKQLCDKIVAEAEGHMERARMTVGKAEETFEAAAAKIEEAEVILGGAKSVAAVAVGDAEDKAKSIVDKVQRELQAKSEDAKSNRSDSATAAGKIIAEARSQAEAISEEALSEVQGILAEAEKWQADSNAAADKDLEEAKRRAQDIGDQAYEATQQEIDAMKAETHDGIQKIMAEIEMMGSALQEEKEAQEIYSEAAEIKAYSAQRLSQARKSIDGEESDSNQQETIIVPFQSAESGRDVVESDLTGDANIPSDASSAGTG